MARKAAKKPAKKAAGKMAGTADPATRIIDAALNLAAEKAWRDISLTEIAEAAALPLSQVYPLYPSKRAILAGYARRIDEAVLAGQEPDARQGSARDRLFDVLMRRFDALAPHKAALGGILYDLGRDPAAGLCAMATLRRSMACMLEAADLSSGGLRGRIRTRALSVLYLASLRVWLRDDSPDLSHTMANLDRSLRRAESAVQCCERVQKKSPQEPPAAA